MKIAIIDYDAGNLANVVRAATRAGLDVVVTRNPEEIREAKAMILPGVGAMKDAMDHLSGYGLTDIIREEVLRAIHIAPDSTANNRMNWRRESALGGRSLSRAPCPAHVDGTTSIMSSATRSGLRKTAKC